MIKINPSQLTSALTSFAIVFHHHTHSTLPTVSQYDKIKEKFSIKYKNNKMTRCLIDWPYLTELKPLNQIDGNVYILSVFDVVPATLKKYTINSINVNKNCFYFMLISSNKFVTRDLIFLLLYTSQQFKRSLVRTRGKAWYVRRDCKLIFSLVPPLFGIISDQWLSLSSSK